MPSSRVSFPPRHGTLVSCIAGRFFITEPLGKPLLSHPLPFLESPLLLILTLYGKCGRAGGQWSSGPKGHTLHCQNYRAVLLRFLFFFFYFPTRLGFYWGFFPRLANKHSLCVVTQPFLCARALVSFHICIRTPLLLYLCSTFITSFNFNCPLKGPHLQLWSHLRL